MTRGESIEVMRPLFQVGERGAVPTSPHQFRVERCRREDIQEVIENEHYSHSINGVISDECFALVFEGKIYGGALFGRMAMANQWKKYADKERGVLELRRLVCTPDAPKNSASFLISKCLKMLRKDKYKFIVSYADENYGHKGGIYRASNFKYEGMTPTGKIIIFEGKKYHDKAIRTKYNGILKPFAQRLKTAIENGTAAYSVTKPKHIFTYKL